MHICKIIDTHLVFAQQVNHFKITRCNKVLLHQHKKFKVALTSAHRAARARPAAKIVTKGERAAPQGTDQCNIKSYVIIVGIKNFNLIIQKLR